MFEGAKFEVSRLYLSSSCLLPSALCLPQPRSPKVAKNQVMVQVIIWMVKLADRISNLQTPPHYWNQDKIIRYREEGIEIYQALKDASPFLASRLATKIEDYKAFVK